MTSNYLNLVNKFLEAIKEKSSPVLEAEEAKFLIDYCRFCGLEDDWITEKIESFIEEQPKDFYINRFGLDFNSTSIEVVPNTQKAKDKFDSMFGVGCSSINIKKSCIMNFVEKMETEGFSVQYF